MPTPQPFWTNGSATLHQADARAIPLPDASVHTVITSPPYYGLRTYTGLLQWRGGNTDCPHTQENPHDQREPPTGVDAVCTSCGAVPTQTGIGNEPTLWEYIDQIVDVFREVRRVLRDDGICWLNLGDSYANDGKWGGYTGGRHPQGLHGNTGVGRTKNRTGLKPKNLMMVPARVAIALQEDGWVIRQRVIWNKPNTTPEAVLDRPASTNEDIYILTKSSDPLFWTHRELQGVRTEPPPDHRWVDLTNNTEYDQEPPDYSQEVITCPDCMGAGELELRAAQLTLFEEPQSQTTPCPHCNHQGAQTPGYVRRWRRVNLWKRHDYFYDNEAVKQPSASGPSDLRKMTEGRSREPGRNKTTSTEPSPGATAMPNIRRKRAVGDPSGANLKNVWTIATQPYREFHFATFPTQIPRLCILAATSEHGVCTECGAPWTRSVNKTFVLQPDVSPGRGIKGAPGQKPMGENNNWDGAPRGSNHVETTGWRPTCNCGAGVRPATVLDPFAGSGTTLAVAQSLGRRSIGLDLSSEYLAMAVKRITG